jgi:hypothetical protein
MERGDNGICLSRIVAGKVRWSLLTAALLHLLACTSVQRTVTSGMINQMVISVYVRIMRTVCVCPSGDV